MVANAFLQFFKEMLVSKEEKKTCGCYSVYYVCECVCVCVCVCALARVGL